MIGETYRVAKLQDIYHNLCKPKNDLNYRHQATEIGIIHNSRSHIWYLLF